MVNDFQDITAWYKCLLVAVNKAEPFYSDQPPFNPHFCYPEYIFPTELNPALNAAYESVRNCFYLLGLDVENFGSVNWNPLKNVIKPCHRVVVKPNFVLSSHNENGNLFSIITHPSVIRAIVDYVFKALEGEGEIIIADAPQMDCNFSELLEKTNLQSIQEFYWKKVGFEIPILDLRDFWVDKKNGDTGAFVEQRRSLPGDPQGSTVINLGSKSRFYDRTNWKSFYGADYDRNETIRHHHGLIHEYMVSNTILSSDVLISVPKLKVHKKVGVTLNTKGMVGINTNKNFLVHYTLGTPDKGGDQFPSNLFTNRERLIINIQRFLYDLLLSRKHKTLDAVYKYTVNLYKKFLKPAIGPVEVNKRIYDAGNWHGNDSAWRMVSDLMKIVIYTNKKGLLEDIPQRKIFSIVDGIIGGENNGPLNPDEKKAGIVIAGFNPLAVDLVGTRIMGFDCQKLKWAVDLINNEHFDFYVGNVETIKILSDIPDFSDMFQTTNKLLNFIAPPGWRGNVELCQE
ncbi:MAG: DUF362 domain-containing protein [Candidatus Hodarchaeota archaeon]